jgi:hypothetical protein
LLWTNRWWETKKYNNDLIIVLIALTFVSFLD